MMQRNEKALLALWLRHYERLFGAESLWIVDDASNEPEVQRVLKEAQVRGVNVLFLEERAGVDRKGEFLSRIREQELSKYEFVLPVDCDEFLYLNFFGSRTSNRIMIQREFRLLSKAHTKIFRISEDVRNYPGTFLGFLQKSTKGFLKRGADISIDVGNHFYAAKNAYETRFGFAHVRNRNYVERLAYSRQKLIDRVPAFDEKTLVNHRDFGQGGRHLVKDFFQTKEAYYASFPEPTLRLSPLLKTREIPYSTIPEETEADVQKALDPVNLEWIGKFFAGHKDELVFFRDQLRSSEFLLEFGTGGSTLLALNAGPKRIVSCETDSDYIDDFRLKHASNFWNFSTIELHHLNVGPTEKWGYPVEPLTSSQTDHYFRVIEEHADADTVFIDGRFRVAVAAKCYLHLRDDAKFLIHDFKREHYSPVLEFLELEEQVGTLALLKKRPNSSDRAERIFREHVADAR
jgi:hypothetical protein